MEKSPPLFLPITRLCLLACLAFAAPLVLSPVTRAQAEDSISEPAVQEEEPEEGVPSSPIAGLELQSEDLLKSREDIEVILQGYYTAVELEDFDWAAAYYAWESVPEKERANARENALDAARLVKQQIDHNGGVQRVAVHGLFQILKPFAVVEVTFNHGLCDLSPLVALVYEKREGKDSEKAQETDERVGEWRLEVVRDGLKIPPPLVGQREMLATFDTVYRAALEEDFEQMRTLAYDSGLFLSLKDDQPEEREKRIARLIETKAKRIQTAARVNKGLVSIDIPLMQESTVYVYTKREPEQKKKGQIKQKSAKPPRAEADEAEEAEEKPEPIAIASAMIRRNYENGKSELWQTSFFLDRDGRWKVNPNTLR